MKNSEYIIHTKNYIIYIYCICGTPWQTGTWMQTKKMYRLHVGLKY